MHASVAHRGHLGFPFVQVDPDADDQVENNGYEDDGVI